MKTQTELDRFTRAYLLAALWTWDDNAPSGDYENGGRPEKLFPLFHESALEKATADCARFERENQSLLSAYRSEVSTRGDKSEDEYAAHDFWLSRNGHGSGFFDRDGLSNHTADRLQEKARAFGSCDLYQGDDGLLYLA